MNTKQLTRMLLVALFVASGSACSPRAPKVELPIVNDENCKFENIKKIEDKDIREEFASMCIRRGSFKPSPKRSW